MGAEVNTEAIGPTSNAYRVTCATHGLNRLVMTPEHAQNIVRMHDRIDHAEDPPPEQFNISAAARAMLAAGDSMGGAYDVWIALTGCDNDEQTAEQLARDYADSPTTAHPAPF